MINIFLKTAWKCRTKFNSEKAQCVDTNISFRTFKKTLRSDPNILCNPNRCFFFQDFENFQDPLRKQLQTHQ